MGTPLTRTDFGPADYDGYARRLQDNLAALREMLRDPGFGKGPGSLGAELELYIIDADGRPLHRNVEILERAADPLLTPELNRFNLEYNLRPVPIAGRPFHSLEESLLEALERTGSHAATFGGRLVPIGILPTLRFKDFGPQAMTDAPRYHVLRRRLRESRDGLFKVRIAGEDELVIETGDITFEGANTSFQVHYRVDPQAFAAVYNALQLVTPLVLAVASNSPTAFGQRLWHETRVPLFKKSIDCRKELPRGRWHQPARVNYGHGWVREGAYELFAETVRLYPPLLPVLDEEEPMDVLRAGGVPSLAELKLHQGTVWLWNRPVYDHLAGGHLRIELRALPSGPSVIDMIANAALCIGLMEGLREQVGELLTALPFPYAVHNFYRAAEWGLNARLVWPRLDGSSLQERPSAEILRELLPVAGRGLRAIGIGQEEIDKYLGVIEGRLERGVTGAIWQLQCYEKVRRKLNDNLALHTMLESYWQQSRANCPVAEWSMPE